MNKKVKIYSRSKKLFYQEKKERIFRVSGKLICYNTNWVTRKGSAVFSFLISETFAGKANRK